jgi:hypothetical protein
VLHQQPEGEWQRKQDKMYEKAKIVSKHIKIE